MTSFPSTLLLAPPLWVAVARCEKIMIEGTASIRALTLGARRFAVGLFGSATIRVAWFPSHHGSRPTRSL